MQNVINIGSIIGRPVLSLETANKLGLVDDLIVDPLRGQVNGLSIQVPDEDQTLVEWQDIASIGLDAVMIEREDALVPADQSPIKSLPRAKNDLIGVNVITERGQLMGTVANISLCLADRPLLIYEVRSSIFDKLLGHAFYFAASIACAFSDDGKRLVVTDDPERMDHNLAAAAKRLLGPYDLPAYQPAAVRVEVRTAANK